METYDILMLVVLAGATLFGAIKGFAWQLASIASIVVSYIVAYKFRQPFSESIKADPPWNMFLAMLILYVGSSLIIWVAFRMVSRSIDRMKLKDFDRQIGAAFGLAKGALFCILITMFAVTLLGQSHRETIVHSKSGYYIAKALDKSDAIIPPELHEVVAPYIDSFEERVGGVAESVEPGAGGGFPWTPGSDSPISSGGASDGLLPDSFWQDAASQSPLPIDPQRWTPESFESLRDYVPQRAQQPSGLPPMRLMGP
ncbi:CvpA family protein [Candidatus Laterigemmans baculatus]|uniref:CvpA family protein n=1 Tax=Candidatus Laterigemmans baculatus TaxID=2770505 RepID=UPI0013DC16B8|nr:CvpA family protein [Candidatus Laterigemmans baculatus]